MEATARHGVLPIEQVFSILIRLSNSPFIPTPSVSICGGLLPRGLAKLDQGMEKIVAAQGLTFVQAYFSFLQEEIGSLGTGDRMIVDGVHTVDQTALVRPQHKFTEMFSGFKMAERICSFAPGKYRVDHRMKLVFFQEHIHFFE